ncbi:hypothetical protein [Bosea sp. UC22_33]|uniref:hypothetical protein n=1 Tax=Bosea sp. UC22_33 TaxID=3350165 RepID=UPI00366D8F8D
MTPLSTPAAQGTVARVEELIFDIVHGSETGDLNPMSVQSAARSIVSMLSASPPPEALPASGVDIDALAKAASDEVLRSYKVLRAEELAMTVSTAVKMRAQALSRALTSAPAPAPSGSGVQEACAQIADAKAREALDRGYRLAKSRTGKDKANAAARMAEEIAAAIRALASDASPRGEAVAWRWRLKDRTDWIVTANRDDIPKQFGVTGRDKAHVIVEPEIQPLYAHPAPATVESDGVLRLARRLFIASNMMDANPLFPRGEAREDLKNDLRNAADVLAALAPATEGRKG